MKNLIKLSLLLFFSFTVISCGEDEKKEKVEISTIEENESNDENVNDIENTNINKEKLEKEETVVPVKKIEKKEKEEIVEKIEKEVKEETVEKEEKEEKPYDLSNKGIGPIKSVTLATDVNKTMVVKGRNIFKSKCTTCHKIEEKFIGPAPNGILERRSPEWIMNMILNPDEMVIKDPDAKALLIEYNGSPMVSQNLTEEEARYVLEYFRTLK